VINYRASLLQEQENQVRGDLHNGARFLFIKKSFMQNVSQHTKANLFTKSFVASLICSIACLSASAQDANAGINQANQQVRSYFASGLNLMYAVGAIVGLIGAIKVYQKWNSGDHDTGKVAAAWFGSCVFLVVVATVIRAFFGI
jgi:hypothetical protein